MRARGWGACVTPHEAGCKAVHSRLHGAWFECTGCFLTCGSTRVGAACGICRRRLAAQGRQPHERTGASVVAGPTYHGHGHDAGVDADAVSNGPLGHDAERSADALLAQHALSGAAGDNVARVMQQQVVTGCAAPASLLGCIVGLCARAEQRVALGHHTSANIPDCFSLSLRPLFSANAFV